MRISLTLKLEFDFGQNRDEGDESEEQDFSGRRKP